MHLHQTTTRRDLCPRSESGGFREELVTIVSKVIKLIFKNMNCILCYVSLIFILSLSLSLSECRP
jgi:hypothetical protein